MEQFNFALKSLAEFCQLGTLENGLLRDTFTALMIDPELQKRLFKVQRGREGIRSREGIRFSHQHLTGRTKSISNTSNE